MYGREQANAVTQDRPADTTNLEGCLAALRSVSSRLSSVLENVGNHADRLHGPGPKRDPNPSGPAAVPNGMIAAIAVEINDLHNKISAINEQQGRIESAFGG